MKLVHGFKELYYLDTSKVDPVKQSYYWVKSDLKGKKAENLELIKEATIVVPITGYYGSFNPSENEIRTALEEQLGMDPDEFVVEIPEQSLTSANILDNPLRHIFDINIYREKKEK